MAAGIKASDRIGGTLEHKHLGLVDAIKTVAAENFGQLLAGMFDGADDSLFAMSEKAASNDDQALFFDAMRALRLDRKKIMQCSVDLVRELPVSEDGPEDAADDIEDIEDLDDLALQDTESLEEQIAVENMVGKAKGLFREGINDLETRLEAVAKEHGEPIVIKGLSPERLCQAFKLAMGPVSMSIDLRLLIYKLFDQHVIFRLGEFYGALNTLLIDRGILPKIRRTTRVPRATGGAQRGAPGRGRPLETPGSAPSYPADSSMTGGVLSTIEADMDEQNPLQWAMNVDLVSALRNEMHGNAAPPLGASGANAGGFAEAAASAGGYPGNRGVGAPAGSGVTGAASQGNVSANQVGSVPGTAAPGSAPGTVVPGGLPEREGTDETLPLQDEVQAVEVVSRFFNELLSDTHITTAARTELARLKVPIAKTSLTDIDFFRNPDHPARALVHELAGMGAIIRDTDSDAYQQVRKLVDRLLRNYTDGPDAFREAVQEIRRITSEEARRFLEEERRFARERKEQAIARAKTLVREEIDSLTPESGIHEALKPFVFKLWAPYMAIQYLRHGRHSEQWEAAVANLEELLQMATDDFPDKAAASRQIEAMVDNLVSVRADRQRVRTLLHNLRQGLDLPQQETGKASDLQQAPAGGATESTPANLIEEVDNITVSDVDGPADMPSADEEVSWTSVAVGDKSEESGDHEKAVAEGRRTRRDTDAQTTVAHAGIFDLPDNIKESADPDETADGETSGNVEPEDSSTAQKKTRKSARARKLMEGLLHPGAWFRLHEDAEEAPHWLRFAEFNEERGTVTLLGSQGKSLTYHIAEFADEVINGSCRPVMDNTEFETLMQQVSSGQSTAQPAAH